jgi:Transposase IS66 family
VIRDKLIAFPVIYCDETGMKVEGKRHWLHVVSNDKYTCYLVHQKRGSEAMDYMEILHEFKGIAFMMDGNSTTIMNAIMLFVMLIYRENLPGLKRTINSSGLKR